MIRLSSTVNGANTRCHSIVDPTPSRTRWCGLSPASSVPPTATGPLVTRTVPAIALSKADLPPVAPDDGHTLAWLGADGDAAQHHARPFARWLALRHDGPAGHDHPLDP
jgi:hypothetical protein